MNTIIKIASIFIFTFGLSVLCYAAPPKWEIIPNESQLTFTGNMNGSPVSAEFKKFSGDIQGDLNQLDKSSVKITIDTNSLMTSYKDIEDTLKTPDWFDVKLFPQAIFEAKEFIKTGDKTYQAKGKLTIRNISLPLNVVLTVKDYSPQKATVTGSTVLKRSDFQVGRGEWGGTDEVKDEVNVNFTISATKK